MFTKVGNTSVGWWFIYQWWLGVFIYFLVIEDCSKELKWNSSFNQQVHGLKSHIWKHLGKTHSGRDLYLEGELSLFEDVNVFCQRDSSVWFVFIQSKSTYSSEYSQIRKIRKALITFFNNKLFQSGVPCCFVIAVNVSFNYWYKDQILRRDSGFRLRLTEEVLYSKKDIRMNSLYRKVSSGKFLDALNARDVKEMQKFSNHDMSVLQSALNIYEQLDRLLWLVYILDEMHPNDMKDFLVAQGRRRKRFSEESLMRAFHQSMYKSTRYAKQGSKDDDFQLYEEYERMGVRFVTSPWTNKMVSGGFLLL